MRENRKYCPSNILPKLAQSPKRHRRFIEKERREVEVQSRSEYGKRNTEERCRGE